jgi:hypothetical protein
METDIGKMIGDINNLDWMDLEKMKEDITFGTTIMNEKIFLIVKYQVEISKNKFKEGVQCFVYDFYRWTTLENGINFMEIEREMSPSQIDLLKNIISEKTGTINETHKPIGYSYIGKKIAIPSLWEKIKAVRKIERNWLICRYEPKYKMCEKVLFHNIEEARKEYLSSL